MTLADDRVLAPERPVVSGFRPTNRRRSRLALGAALVAIAVGGNVLVYSSLDRRESVVQVVRDVPAGQQLVLDDLREVEVAADATVRTIPATQLGAVVGQYARVRLVAGSLVVAETLQGEPLVAPGSAVVAVQVPEGAVPIGLRERSLVRLVLPPRPGDDAPPIEVPGQVVGLPSAPQSVSGRLSVSIEVDDAVAASVVARDDVRVVLVDPLASATEPAIEPISDPESHVGRTGEATNQELGG